MSFGLGTNALSSLGNLSLTIVLSHRSGPAELGQYAIAFAIYAFTTGIVRAAITESVLGAVGDTQRRSDATHEVSLAGVAGFAIIATVGLILRSPYIVFTGVAIHGILIYDYIKIVNMALLRPVAAFRQECCWTLVTLAVALAGLLKVADSDTVYGAWAISCAAIGYVHAIVLRLRCTPKWPSSRVETRLSILYTLDQIMGGGAVQVTTYLVAGVSGLAVVGVLRAAGVFYSPLTLVSTTSRSIAIPSLVLARANGPAAELRKAVKIAGLQVVVLAPLAIVAPLLPLSLCSIVVGDNARLVLPVLPPLAIEAVINVVLTVAFAGHRAQRAGKRTLMVYSVMFPVRVSIVVLCSWAGGALGAAWGMAAAAFVGMILFWLSYSDLVHKSSSCS
jgi:hypothetical protein